MSVGENPFRSDGRMHRRVSCAPPDDAMRVIARGSDVLPFAGYVTVLALGTTACVLQLPGTGVTGYPVALFLLLVAALFARLALRRSDHTPRQLAAMPTSCAFTAGAMVLEGAFGETVWRYEGIRALTRDGPWLEVNLDGGRAVVLRADEPASEPLEAFIARSAPRMERRDRRLTLAALALAYLALSAVGVVVARTYGG